MTCNQCEMLSINGLACHETGCPNAKKEWDKDRQEWIAFVDCFTCGYPVEVGTACNCQDEDCDAKEDIETTDEETFEDLRNADYIEDFE